MLAQRSAQSIGHFETNSGLRVFHCSNLTAGLRVEFSNSEAKERIT